VNEAGAGGTGGSGGTGVGGGGGEAGATCDPGFTTCPGSAECATRLAVGNPHGATVDDCGACGHTCSREGATASACSDGVCVATCAPNYSNCSVDDGTHPNNGCETYLDSLTACGTACNGRVTCNPDQVCNGGSCVAADGLAVMSIPFTATGQAQRCADEFNHANLAGSTLTLRLYAPGATNGYVNTFLVDGTFRLGPATTTQFTTLSAGWTDVVIEAGQPSASFDSSDIYEVSLDVYANGTEPWANPTIVYLDSVWSSNLAVNDTFDTTKGGMVSSSLVYLVGSTLGWTAALP
jgi:hypothetical protein